MREAKLLLLALVFLSCCSRVNTMNPAANPTRPPLHAMEDVHPRLQGHRNLMPLHHDEEREKKKSKRKKEKKRRKEKRKEEPSEEGESPFSSVKAGLDIADKAVDVVDKGVDVLNKIDQTLTGKLNAHYESVAQRPESLIKPGDLAAIGENMKPGQSVTFENLRGYDGLNEYQPPGWRYEVGGGKEPEEPDAEEEQPHAYPMGVGMMLMSGCFGTGYQPGDPCYKSLRFVDRCDDQIDAANFIGVGFDITKTYSSESRKKSVVQRNCANKARFAGDQVPDNMNAYGIYDYSVKTESFQSAEDYRKYLAKKSGTKMSTGVFDEIKDEFQTTKSAGDTGFIHDIGAATSFGGSDSLTSGTKFSSSLEKQAERQGSHSTQSMIAVLEADMKLYEIALDYSSPDDLSVTFLKDFERLPTSYYLIGADVKLQNFVLRYGTHYVKSAVFGGKLDIFKTATSNSKQTGQQFAVTAEEEFSAMMSTLETSYVQKSAKVNILGSGKQYGSKSNYADGTRTEQTGKSKATEEIGSRAQSRSEFISTTINIQGGDPEIAAAITDFYTPAFKNRFVKWLGSIQSYPKPYDMTFGRIPDLFDVSADSLFKEGKGQGGCFGDLKVDEEKRRYFLQNTTTKDPLNNTVTTSKKVFCYTSKEQFLESFKAKRLALERSITIFMAEGPFSTASFDLPEGANGCETETIDYTVNSVQQSHSWPTSQDMLKKSFKVLFELPFDLPIMKSDMEFEVMYRNRMWFTKLPGNRFTIDNTCPPANGFELKNRVCVAGLYLLYKPDFGYFTFDNEYYKNKTSYDANISRALGEKLIARAESEDILHGLETGKLGDVPCNVKWSNSHRIDPSKKINCIHFSAASKGDIFVIFASIPKDYTTWFYLQLSPTGTAFYRAMKLEGKDVLASGTLGDETLFETFFVCVKQGNKKDINIMYGKSPAQREVGVVHSTFTFPMSQKSSISFYTFGSGEAKVTIDDLRVIKERPVVTCTGEGLIEVDGECMLDCDPQCNGCRQAKDPKNCLRCKNMKHLYEGGSFTDKFICLTECPAGYEPNKKKICTPCKAGYHKNSVGNNKCVACGPGTVAPKDGLITCGKCGKGKYQNEEGQSSCLDCGRGTYNHKVGMSACNNCQKGYYQNKTRQEACVQCDFGYKCPSFGLKAQVPCRPNTYNNITGFTGTVCKGCANGEKSREASQRCGNACIKGKYLRSGFGCTLCGIGTIAPANGMDHCQQCPTGKTSNSQRTQCEEIDECESNPCQNGGTCEDRNSTYHCKCKEEFTGKSCETDVDECKIRNPCRNNAPCKNTHGSYTCSCTGTAVGYKGRHCEIDIDECALKTDNCHRSFGTCKNAVGTFRCSCNPGYSGNGVTCTDINECTAKTHNCHKYGTCTNTVGSFSCSCRSGFRGNGRTCTDVDECTEGTHNCERADARGICTNTAGSFGCKCKLGSRGDGITCKVDGKWGNWGNWGTCTKKCGGGRHSRSRTCNNPPPSSNGGNKCSGDATQSGSCNRACEAYVVDLRITCFDQCGKRGGSCPGYCGPNGYCCRRGYAGCTPDMDAVAYYKAHTCVRYTGGKRIAYLVPLVKKLSKEEVTAIAITSIAITNIFRQDCFKGCGNAAGICPNVCGPNGYCCRRGHPGCPGDMQAVAPPDYYACIRYTGGDNDAYVMDTINCWNRCHQKAGSCPAAGGCGINGYCCKNGDTNCPANMQVITADYHTCVKSGPTYNEVEQKKRTGWKLQQTGVCFEGRDNKYGKFTLKNDGRLTAIKLVHTSGSVSCGAGSSGNSNWGCGEDYIIAVITDNKNDLIFPKALTDRASYNLPNYSSTSKELVLDNPSKTIIASKGKEMRLWYGEDLKGFYEGDNHGRSCADVYAIFELGHEDIISGTCTTVSKLDCDKVAEQRGIPGVKSVPSTMTSIMPPGCISMHINSINSIFYNDNLSSTTPCKGMVSSFLSACICKQQCPEHNIDYYGHDEEGHDNVQSWEICSQKCQDSASCYAWSWVSSTFQGMTLRFRCLYKKSTFSQGRKTLQGVISGTKSCVGGSAPE